MSGNRQSADDQANGTRRQAFGYRCNGCGHCCHHFLVSLNGYEVERLAGARALSVPAFERLYTAQRGGQRVLRQVAKDGRCVFRSEQGCAVYGDRPLACRLYPLVRTVGSDGLERWRIPEPDPESRADQGTGGVIADYLAAQEAEPYIAAVST